MAEAGIICSQILLTVFNIIQFIFGWILIIAGAVIKVNIEGTVGTQAIPIFLIVIGVILVVVSIMGCVGAWIKNFCLLVTFCVFSTLIFVLVIIAVAISFAFRSKADEIIRPGLDSLITSDISAFEFIQKEFQCCGVDGPADWKKNEHYKDGSSLPPSCCGNQTVCNVNSESVYKKGCQKPLTELYEKSFIIMGGITAACAIILLIVIIVAAWLAHTIRGSYHAV